MKIKPETVRKVASIARIDLSDEEVRKFAAEFEDVLELFSHIDTSEADDDFSIKNLNEFREDIVGNSLAEKDVFLNTQNQEEGFFKGPKIK